MAWKPITKPKGGWKVVQNILDYDRTSAEFSWDKIQQELSGLPGGRGLNIAHEAVDRRAGGPRRNHRALRWLGI